MEFSKKDLEQIQGHNLSLAQIEKQLENFKKGFPFVNLEKPAVIGDGILQIEESNAIDYVNAFEDYAANASIVKFVPASGAATRMFKDLYDFKSSFDSSKNSLEDFPAVKEVIDNIKQFAFYESLLPLGIENALKENDYLKVVELILEDSGLSYGQSPKATIVFHKYDDEVRTSFEEHLVEAAKYCLNDKKEVRLHFTISGNHQEKFSELLKKVKVKYEERFSCTYEIEFSEQKSSTDTVAVYLDNSLVRDNEGNIVFRPAGHGALIENLNEINADIVFIKNIDNVIHDKYKDITYKYKKVLAGILVSVKKKIDSYLNILSKQNFEKSLFEEIKGFCKNNLFLELKDLSSFKDVEDYRDYLLSILNRPIRVCGMVKNEGQPGGGPFWIRRENVELSLQIVESAQVDMRDENQKEIFNNSTHFNPVDLVCLVKNFKGEKFELTDFVDYNTGFITEKSQQAHKIKVQELPGLWNGSMANWISIFVQVPLETFTPVKTINNLLDKGHNPF
jgi:hypothetical protein